jgi:hypothetical protein
MAAGVNATLFFWDVTPFSLVGRYYYGLERTCILSLLT